MDFQHYKNLSTSEKVLLVEEIWDSIADEKIMLTKQQKAIIDDRLAIFNSTTKRLEWEEIKKNVRAKK